MTPSRPHRLPWTVSPADEAVVSKLAKEAGLSHVVARLLVSRGVIDAPSADRFLHPSFDRDWRDPELLFGIDWGADIVAKAVAERRRIVVFGDFDADGVAGAAVLCRALASLGGLAEVVLPHRFRDGYGLTETSVAKLLSVRPELVVTVDCGIGSAAAVRELLADGVGVVVTDHHEPSGDVPLGVPVINPKLDRAYPFDGLAGAGVALKLAQAVGRRLGRPDAFMDLVDLAMLGTIADVVPLVDENRALVVAGLRATAVSPRVSISALAEVAGLDVTRLCAKDVAFALAPRVNAAGRMADPLIAFELLATDDMERATCLAREVDELNRLRQAAERDLFELALGDAKAQADQGATAGVIAGEGWHEGVRGIVASRLARHLSLPAMVFTLEDDRACGSGRSVPGLDIHSAVAQASEMLERFGGHPMAVGATLEASRLDEFREVFCSAVSEFDLEARGVSIEGELRLEDVGIELAAELALLEPFGEGNPRPLFGVRGAFMNERRRVGKDGDHLLFDAFDGVSTVPAVAFRLDEIELAAAHDAPVDLAFEIESDEWRGRERARLLVRHLHRHEPEDTDGPAATLVEDLFDAAPTILAREAYHGIEEAESFHTKLAGVTFEGRQDVIDSLSQGVPLRVVREPENPHDANACALFAPDGRQIGYFNRRLAAVLASLLDDGLALDVTVTEVTGGEGQSFGVNVLVERRRTEESASEDSGDDVRASLATLDASSLERELVQNLLGDRSLRSAQERSIQALARGEDCLAVMATGRGKSLIFHLHAASQAILGRRGSVFVYPLRALVADQEYSIERSLGALGVRSAVATGETSIEARDEVFSRFSDGALDIVLTTPEFLERHASRFARTGRVGFVVVDEAHHIALASAGRRPAYGRLGEALDLMGRPQVLAVTATAGDEVTEAIVSTLGIGAVVVDPAVRENLRIEDRRGGGEKVAHLASVASRGEKLVAYVNSREQSVRIAQQLRTKVPSLKHRCAFYNGGLSRGARRAVESAFRAGDLTCVVATSAFGEGVDISDIRHVVHYHLPFNEIEFNQMSGRGGRDGAAATVHLLYGPRDSRLNQLILESVAPERDDLAQLYLVLREMQGASAEDFEATNAELAERVAARRPRTRLTDKGVSAALGVFRELGLVSGEGAGSYRRLRLHPRPEEKVDLSASIRYEEGIREQATFAGFRDWALDAPADELLARFNRPILPTRYA